MLIGKIKYRDEDFGEITLDVKAKHSVNNITFCIDREAPQGIVIQSVDTELYRYLDVIDKDKLEDGTIIRKFTEGVKWADKNGVETTYKPTTDRVITVKTDSNRVTTNVGNLYMAARLGAIISYCKANAKGKTKDSEFSDTLIGHLDSKVAPQYKDVPVVCDIVYKQTEIVKLDIESPYFSIHLDYFDEKNLDMACFKPLKQKDKWDNLLSITPVKIITVRLNKPNLGWDTAQQIKKTISIMGMYQNIEDVIEAHPEKDTSWILDRKYIIVTDDILEDVIEEFKNYDGYIAFDTETTGLKINFLSREGRADQLVGVILSKEIGTGYYFPLQHKYITNLCGGDHYFFMQHYMKPILEQKKIVVHNGKFDWKVAYIYNIVVNIVYDTMIALGVTKRYEILNFELGLKSLAASLLGLDMFDLADFIIGENDWGDDNEITFADLPEELVRRYGPADGDMTLSLKGYIDENHIIEDFDAQAIFELEVRFSQVVAYSEFWGYHIDAEKIPQLKEQIVSEMEMHKQAAFKIAGHEFNMNSTPQLNKVMYDELHIEMVDGKKGTDKGILKILSEKENTDGTPKYPFVRHLKAYRDVESIYKNFLKRLKEFATDDGYIFPDVLFLGTETGRCSVKNPNYQSYNDTVKHYVVPRKDYIMGDSDFGQIEYRTLASIAKESTLIQAFNDPDLDYHQYQAARMFNVPYAAVTKKLRQQSKGINFGLPYGMGDTSLGIRIFGERSAENTRKAAKLREKFFEGQDNIRAFFDRVRDEGVKNGYTSTYWGRRRYYHKGTFTTAEIRRQAGNHVIQGSAADIYKKAVVAFFNFIQEYGLLDKVLINAFIHDEILFEVHKSIDLLWFTTKWREAFEVPIPDFCKLYAGLGYGKCWYDAKKLDLPTGYITALCELSANPDRVNKDFIFDNVSAEKGYEWHGDIDLFLSDLKHWFNNYKYQRVYDYIQDEESQGKIIKPAIWSLLTECVADLIPVDLVKLQNTSVELADNIVKRITTEVRADVITYDSEKNSYKIKCNNLDEYVAVFSIFKGIDYTKLNILSPDAKEKANVDFNDKLEVVENTETICSSNIETARAFIEMGDLIHDAIANVIFIDKAKPDLVSFILENSIENKELETNKEAERDTNYLRVIMLGADSSEDVITDRYVLVNAYADLLTTWMSKKGGVFF